MSGPVLYSAVFDCIPPLTSSALNIKTHTFFPGGVITLSPYRTSSLPPPPLPIPLPRLLLLFHRCCCCCCSDYLSLSSPLLFFSSLHLLLPWSNLPPLRHFPSLAPSCSPRAALRCVFVDLVLIDENLLRAPSAIQQAFSTIILGQSHGCCHSPRTGASSP